MRRRIEETVDHLPEPAPLIRGLGSIDEVPEQEGRSGEVDAGVGHGSGLLSSVIHSLPVGRICRRRDEQTQKIRID